MRERMCAPTMSKKGKKIRVREREREERVRES